MEILYERDMSNTRMLNGIKDWVVKRGVNIVNKPDDFPNLSKDNISLDFSYEELTYIEHIVRKEKVKKCQGKRRQRGKIMYRPRSNC